MRGRSWCGDKPEPSSQGLTLARTAIVMHSLQVNIREYSLHIHSHSFTFSMRLVSVIHE